ncbi:hypothetical protein DACRYDRAFT_21316 [Dacryopinax primogenitus]|uniref:Zn(2)-C6 fungal-type domain-containing protein n=1 Tax=Dacryopinax primogenitus (strain DJM 731) TaxID=1858805 RepID=M5GCJ9_DACPD|nr:uncharacterized protein DACRYDRAFT_21316 [Dacryopinax primogenitus]EJU03922.1 hypothetical protein DACRYDRAFT_21316 [Dacryopinax primogenitus]
MDRTYNYRQFPTTVSEPSEAPIPPPSSSTRLNQKQSKACDACHRRKIKCNGEEEGPHPCSYCRKNGYECTYNHQPNKWPPSKAYVDGLEHRVGELERRVEYLKRELVRARSRPTYSTSSPESSVSGEILDKEQEAKEEDPETQAALEPLAQEYEDLMLGNAAGSPISQEPRMYHEKGSHFQVVNQQLVEIGSKSIDKNKFFQLRIRPECRVVDTNIFDEVNLRLDPPTWPEPDLAKLLIDTYFEKWNCVLPLLHKPTFLRQYADPKMRLDNNWVSVVFGVFAIASKLVDDPRALGPPDENGHYFDAGMKYFNEMRRIGSPLYAPPSLFRLQAIILFANYLCGHPLCPSVGWALIGLGLRYLQDAGMHLKKEWLQRAKAHPFDYEMRKRVFWILYAMERTMALEMDRSFCLPEHDYDIEPLLELDDDALDLLQQGQKDPVGFSQCIAAFNVRVYLLQIASHKRGEMQMLRHCNSNVSHREETYLYGVNIRLQNVKAKLDTDLIYQKDQADPERLLYSSLVHIQFHWVQLILYRPFFSKSQRMAHPEVPILAVSGASSREIAIALEGLRAKNMLRGRVNDASLAGFVAGSVLIMNMWEQKGLDGIDEVNLCLKALKSVEDRWQFPGLLYDVLKNFADIMTNVVTGNCPLLGDRPICLKLSSNSSHRPCDKDASEKPSSEDASSITDPGATVPTTIVSHINGNGGASTNSNQFGEFATFSMGAPDLFTPFSAVQTGSLFDTNIGSAGPTSTATNQPMFGEDGWLNHLDLNGQHGFMDPTFNEWLTSMIIASQETFPMDNAATSSAAGQSMFSTNDAANAIAASGDSTWNSPWWTFDQPT